MVFNNIKVIRHFILNAKKPLCLVYCKFGIQDLMFYKYTNCLSNKTAVYVTNGGKSFTNIQIILVIKRNHTSKSRGLCFTSIQIT